ncbi:MAG TPA: hypothetical protein VJ508_04775, partial [Saprospiraceae bacterium]|nr:hypothetical protein [Saprospiraceae bacterium]
SNAPGSSIAHNPYILGDLCYLSYYHDGVQVFDISNPTNITNYGYYDTYPDNTDYNGYVGCWGCYPFLPSGTILGSDMNNGLFMLQLGNNPLDIEFLAFDASRQGPDVRLNWTVADASFGNRFEIQRSVDKGTTWSKLGEVKLVDAATHYTFYDQTIQDGRQYLYRIDFMQLDGKRISSPLRHIVTISKETAISVANPIDQALILNLTKAMPSLDLKLYDFEGKLVWSQSLDQPVAQMQFDVSQLGPGQYVLTMNWPEGSENLLVQKVN